MAGATHRIRRGGGAARSAPAGGGSPRQPDRLAHTRVLGGHPGAEHRDGLHRPGEPRSGVLHRSRRLRDGADARFRLRRSRRNGGDRPHSDDRFRARRRRAGRRRSAHRARGGATARPRPRPGDDRAADRGRSTHQALHAVGGHLRAIHPQAGRLPLPGSDPVLDHPRRRDGGLRPRLLPRPRQVRPGVRDRSVERGGGVIDGHLALPLQGPRLHDRVHVRRGGWIPLHRRNPVRVAGRHGLRSLDRARDRFRRRRRRKHRRRALRRHLLCLGPQLTNAWGLSNYTVIVQGVVILLVLFLLPGGLASLARVVRRATRRGKGSSAGQGDAGPATATSPIHPEREAIE